MHNHPSIILKQARLKVTPARQAIIDLFSEPCGPLSAEDSYKKLKSKKINQVTVYRTLASLEQKGILRRVELRQDSVHYELASHHHHHIVCTECGRLEDFKLCTADMLSKKILNRSKTFTGITGHSLEFFGVCKSCIKR
jgi:Fur family transcriptional regulator, ferric uptake regulator